MPSTATRRSTQKRSTDTRRRILNAAVESLVEDGFAATSTLAVQQRAAVSRGRLLHHFGTRDKLLLATLDHLVETRTATAAGMTNTDMTDHERVDCTIDWVWESFHQPLWFAAMELWTAARTSPALREALSTHERRIGKDIRGAIADSVGSTVAQHPDFAVVADQVTSSMRGVAMTYNFETRDYLTDPHLPWWRESLHRL